VQVDSFYFIHTAVNIFLDQDVSEAVGGEGLTIQALNTMGANQTMLAIQLPTQAI
jgi:hypothetical protein